MEEKIRSGFVREPKALTKSQRRNKILLLLGALLAFNFFVFGTIYLPIYKDGLKKTAENMGLSPDVERKISPTSFPFQEITIPYLRSRSYESFLGEMGQLSQNGSYTSYLTSYNSDGLKIYGQLTVPIGEKPKDGWPAIVFVHGYILPQNYQTFVNYASYVDYLARSGFVIFKIDLRGHGDSEGEPGGGYYSGDYIVDTLNARAALQNLDFINPGAVGLWGHSMAGNVIARALAVRLEIPAIVIWAGAVYTYEDFSEFRIEDNSYQRSPSDSPSRKRRSGMFDRYGQFDPNSSFWKQVPMTNYLSGIKGAISLNHAVDDTVVDIRYSRNLNNLLDNTSIDHELNEYASGGHNFVGGIFDEAMGNTVEFFKKYLH